MARPAQAQGSPRLDAQEAEGSGACADGANTDGADAPCIDSDGHRAVTARPQPASLTKKSSKPSSSGDEGGATFESSTLAAVDPHSGVVTKGESSLGRVSIGNGQIVIRGINVSVAVTNSGKPKGKVAVNVGAASIGGVPVTIDQDGVHVKGTSSNLPYAKADDALNGALKKAGVELHTVEPEIKKATNELTITATGVHVAFVQPADAPGVPSQFVDHIVGEVFVDSLAAPAPPIPNLNFAGGAGSALGGTASGGSFGSGRLHRLLERRRIVVRLRVAAGLERQRRASLLRSVAALDADEQADLAPGRDSSCGRRS